MSRFVRAAAVFVFTLATAAACTPAQIRAWVNWHSTDPEAAEEFANLPHIQDELHANASSDAPQFREYLTNNHAGTWERIAWCESGGQWNHPPVTNRHGTFSGGVMIMHSVWRHYGGTQFASAPYLASRAEQIEISERILADVGWGAWQCA